jgi:hypothetical protein
MSSVKAHLHRWTFAQMSAGGPADHHDQKEILLGSLLIRRTSAQMSASVNKPLVGYTFFYSVVVASLYLIEDEEA